MKKYLPILKKCQLFDRIDEADLERVLSCFGARCQFFDKRYTIFPEGSNARYIGIVLSGAVQLTRVDYFGNRSIIAEVRDGEVFGEAFACSQTPQIPLSIVASEPSEIMLIESSHVMYSCSHNCDFHKQIIFNLMRELASKNVRFHQRMEITSKRSTREKLLTYLMMESKKEGSRSFDIPYDRQELADYLEVDRSGLSSEIGKLKREGIIENNKRHFVLH